MSDHGNAQLYVYDCPEDQRAAIVEILAGGEYGLSIDWTDHPPEPGEALEIGECYGDNQARLDTNETLAAEIIAAAPGATFTVWVDPVYEYPGCITSYAPDLGRFDSECDADGNPTVTARRVRDIIEDPGADVRAILAAELGLAHEQRFAELRAKLTAQAPA